jgi:hypothetical protein
MQIPDRWHKVEHHGLIASAAREEEHPLMVFDANRIKAFHQEETGIMKHIIKLGVVRRIQFSFDQRRLGRAKSRSHYMGIPRSPHGKGNRDLWIMQQPQASHRAESKQRLVIFVSDPFRDLLQPLKLQRYWMSGSRAVTGRFTSQRAACSGASKEPNLLYRTVASLRLAIHQRSIMKARSAVGF